MMKKLITDAARGAVLYMLLAAVAGALVPGCSKSDIEIMAVTGATPSYVIAKAPGGLTLEVNGLVKRTYSFTSRSLAAFPSMAVRTREVSPKGEFEGAYFYSGIPLVHIMDGVAPKKTEKSPFDKPLDIIVTFTAANGAKARFSYGELAMADDAHPVVLAYHRKEIRPFKDDKKTYNKNIHRENVKGLRLICPRDSNTARYLDDVRSITFSEPDVSGLDLPVTKKGAKCVSKGVTCVTGAGSAPAVYAGVPKISMDNWVRVGHGMGYKGISKAEGYRLTAFLKRNNFVLSRDRFYLFVGCDGYRCIFSGWELFDNEYGSEAMLITSIDGKKPAEGPMLGPVRDFFVDRDLWGFTHAVQLDDTAVADGGKK